MKKEKTGKNCSYASVGGQALMDGILMRAPTESAFVVRLPDKSLFIEKSVNKSVRDRIKILNIPVVRGVVNFVEMLLVGYKALSRSIDMTMGIEEEEAATEKEKEKNKAMTAFAIVLGTVLGIVLALAMMIWLPTWITGLLGGAVPAIKDIGWLRALIEGLMKILIFTGYICLCSLNRDIKRVFMYHGAEHKTIFCYEKQLPLTVENVRMQKRLHPRCGTSFIVIMIVVSVLAGAFIPTGINVVLRSAIKLLMLPVVLGLGYELLKICGKYDNVVTRIISYPGLLFQKITTKEPDDDGIIEVGIAALQAALGLEITVDTGKADGQADVDEEEKEPLPAADER